MIASRPTIPNATLHRNDCRILYYTEGTCIQRLDVVNNHTALLILWKISHTKRKRTQTNKQWVTRKYLDELNISKHNPQIERITDSSTDPLEPNVGSYY